VLRRTSGPKRNEITGGCREVNNEKLHSLYTSPNIIRIIKPRKMRWEWNVACRGPERKRPLRRPEAGG
jgi:hypothetical protein